MFPTKLKALLLSLLLASTVTAWAQDAIVIQQLDGTWKGFVYTDSGIIVLKKIEVHVRPINPTPPPIVAGKLDVGLIYESGLVTERQAGLHTIMQTRQDFQDWKKSKGHRILIMDKDGKDSTKQPSPLTAKFLKAIADRLPTQPFLTLPVIVIIDQSSGGVLFVGNIPADANEMLVLLKKHAGG